MNSKTMAARLIVARGVPDGRDLRAYLLDREIGHSENPLTTLADSLVDIALAALRELAALRGTTVEACLMDLLDPTDGPTVGSD